MVQQPAQPMRQQAKPQLARQPAAPSQPVQAAAAQQPSKKKSKWWLWVIIIIVAIVAGFALGYFLF